MIKKLLLLIVILCLAMEYIAAQGTRIPEETSSPIHYLENRVGIGLDAPNQPFHIYYPYGSGTLNQLFFGDNNTYERAYDYGGLNCMVGEFGDTDTDILQIHGKKGLKLTTGSYQFGNYSVGAELKPTALIVNKKLSIEDNILLQQDFKIGSGIGSTEYYGITFKKSGLSALTNGSGLPYNFGSAFESDAIISFIESDNSVVRGWMDLNAGDFEWLGKATLGSCVVNSVIEAREIKVSTAPGADYVFSPDYPLRELSQVEEFIKENKHLPDIPSASEMEASGVNLAEMNKLLLQKIEELTLYVIEQNQQINELQNTVIQIKNSSENNE